MHLDSANRHPDRKAARWYNSRVTVLYLPISYVNYTYTYTTSYFLPPWYGTSRHTYKACLVLCRSVVYKSLSTYTFECPHEATRSEHAIVFSRSQNWQCM